MSERIKVTVVPESNNGNEDSISIIHDCDMTIMSTLLKENLMVGNFCGGRGSCKRCRIQFLSGATVPSQSDRAAFTPDELRKGWRLACLSRPKADCAIRLAAKEWYEQAEQTEIVTESQRINSKDSGIAACDAECGSAGYIIAVDLGTTTIAMQLMEVHSGGIIDTYCSMNPQRSYGADVLSRIQAANAGHGQELQKCVWEVLNTGIARFCRTVSGIMKQQANTDESERIRCMCVAGNTTMEHLLMGLSTESLGKSPFTPVETGLQKCMLPYPRDCGRAYERQNLAVYITPGVSAFVGGDIVAGLYHCGMLDISQAVNPEQEQIQDRCEAALFIDLGTNGEMAVTDGKRMIVTATAAGPAFEGGANASAPGSDMVAVMASLLRQGIIDKSGLLEEKYFEQGMDVPLRMAKRPEEGSAEPEGSIEPDGSVVIHIAQKDVRDIQMAKAAVRAGIEILYEKIGRPKLMHVYLAGGFGYYLNVNAAIDIGLLPEYMRDIVTAAGNTSLAGAFEIGRELWFGRLNGEMLEDKLQTIESINLANQENFEAIYLNNLNFPKMHTEKNDKFYK